jgi:hypothetical protein
MVRFNEDSFTITVETIIDPVQKWRDLQNSIIECLAAASSDLLCIEAARPLLALLEDMQPDWETAKKMIN